MFCVITFDEAPLPKLSIKHLFIATPTRVHVGLRLDDGNETATVQDCACPRVLHSCDAISSARLRYHICEPIHADMRHD